MGNKGYRYSEESKRKMSLAKLGIKRKPFSEEHKKKISEALKGENNPAKRPEVRKKIGESLKGNIPWMKGKKHTKESKKKISIKGLGRKLSEKTKKKMSEYQKKTDNCGRFKKGQKTWNKGKSSSKETIKKIKIARAKQKNTFTSSIEVKVQNFLKKMGIEFFTHQYMKIEHGYQCDILIPSMNLVIECDGDYWHRYPIGTEIDHVRTNELIEKGFKVLRLWEFEINELNINSFKNKLQEANMIEIKNG